MNLRKKMLLVLKSKDGDVVENYVNIVSGLTAWNAAKDSGYPLVWMYSDSIGHGDYITSPATNGWMQKLETRLHSLYGTGGKYYTFLDTSNYTIGTGWIGGGQAAQGAGPQDKTGWYHLNGQVASNLVFTATGRYFDLYYQHDGNSGPFTYQFDSETPVDGLYGDDRAIERITFDAGSDGEHTITIAAGTGRVRVSGIVVRSDAPGAVIFNASYGGLYSYNFFNDNGAPYQFDTMIPDLVIFALDINDYKNSTQVPLATYLFRVQWMLTHATPTASILFVAENPIGIEKTIPQTDYHDVLRTLAVDNGYAFIDLYNLMGGSAQAAYDAGYFDDLGDTHPNIAGHLFYYNSVEPYLTTD